MGKNCNKSKFDFKNIQYYCDNCGKFYCNRCSIQKYIFEHKDSFIEERPVCRCDNCRDSITVAEANLRQAMSSHDFATLDRVYSEIKANKVDIDVKLDHEAEVLHLKLEKELDIKNFISSVAHVDNYKTIRKSVTVLNSKYKEAEKLGVEVDQDLVQQINECAHRLISERNLRFEMENMYVSAATKDTVDKLKELITAANDYSVEQKYMDAANSLCTKMNDNILARETLQLLIDYP